MKVVKRGKGTWRNAVDVTLNVGAVGDLADAAPVRKATAKTVTVSLSPGASRALAIVAENGADRDALAAKAILAADARNARRVWDIDVAAALGVEMTPEAVAAWRREKGIPTPEVPWPNKVSETPRP